MTHTRTVTTTFTRTEFLVRQLDMIVRTTTGSTSFYDVMRKGAENRWIDAIHIGGMNDENRVVLEIKLSIDWETHEVKLESPSEAVIHVDPSLPESEWLSRIIASAMQQFDAISRDFDLRPRWAVTLSEVAHQDLSHVRRELGLGRGSGWRWVDIDVQPILVVDSFDNFPELGLEFRMAVE